MSGRLREEDSDMGTVEPLRLGLVGCGWVTENRHLPSLARLREVEVAGLADLDRGRCELLAGRFEVRAYRTPEELLADPTVEAVAVCVPASAHVDVALAALEAGKHVFVEKPLALSLDEADVLVERAAELPLTAATGFNLRWHRQVLRARELVRAGAIGRVTAVATAYADTRLLQPTVPAWRTRRELGGGTLTEKLVHHFDLWRFLLDDEVAEVFAFTRGEDEVATVSGRLRSGALAQALSSDLTALRNEVVVHGEEGMLRLDLYRYDGLDHIVLAEMPGAIRTRLRRVVTSPARLLASVGEIRRGGAYVATYEAQWRGFASAVRTGVGPGSTFADGRAALAVVLAAAASASRGSPVRVEDAPASLVAATPMRVPA